MKWLVGLALVAVTAPARADHLELWRNASLMAAPSRSSPVVARLEAGGQLALAGGAQQEGYYPVVSEGGRRGYVYRTLVRRHRGGPAASAFRVHVIDVGQGSAVLLEFECGAVLVDTGGELNRELDSATTLSAYLEAFFARRSDLERTFAALYITHSHLDHVRNVGLVLERFAVQNVITNGLASGSGALEQTYLEDWARSHGARVGLETLSAEEIGPGGVTSDVIDPVACDTSDPELSVLWGSLAAPPDDWTREAFDDANNHSLVLRVSAGRASLLISGDLEAEGIAGLLDRHRGTRALDVDLWHVGHHGSHNGTTEPLLRALSPELALISAGAAERRLKWSAWLYGHPRDTSFDLLLGALERPRRAVSAPVATDVKAFATRRLDEALYSTSWDGSVVVSARRNGTYAVETER